MHRKKDRVARSPFENNSSANTCLVGYVARHDQIARENAFLCSRPFHRLIIERWPPVFLLPPLSLSLSLLFSFSFIPVSHYSPCRPYRSRTRGFVSNAATASYYTDYRLLETEAASGTASVARFSAPTFPTVATVSIERHCFTDDYEELRSFFFKL